MPKKINISDEEIISALLAEGSITAAASSLKCKREFLSKRMQAPEFKELYKNAKDEILKSATAKLQNHISGAINNLVNIMDDEKIAPQIRVNASTTVLQFAARFTREIDIVERLEDLEEAYRNEEEERARHI